MKSKYDRPALKLEFFQSEIDEIKSFFTDKWLPYNSEIRKRTNWRPTEKKKHKEKIVEKAIERNAEKQAKELQVPLEDLMKWKKAILQLLLKQVSRYVKSNQEDKDPLDIDVWDAEKIMKMFKTELWEPATISSNFNINTNKVEWLTDEESEALDVLMSWKSQKNKKSNK